MPCRVTIMPPAVVPDQVDDGGFHDGYATMYAVIGTFELTAILWPPHPRHHMLLAP
jgi:hypothetical protein